MPPVHLKPILLSNSAISFRMERFAKLRAIRGDASANAAGKYGRWPDPCVGAVLGECSRPGNPAVCDHCVSSRESLKTEQPGAAAAAYAMDMRKAAFAQPSCLFKRLHVPVCFLRTCWCVSKQQDSIVMEFSAYRAHPERGMMR